MRFLGRKRRKKIYSLSNANRIRCLDRRLRSGGFGFGDNGGRLASPREGYGLWRSGFLHCTAHDDAVSRFGRNDGCLVAWREGWQRQVQGVEAGKGLQRCYKSAVAAGITKDPGLKAPC
jgi:hypothetical protein